MWMSALLTMGAVSRSAWTLMAHIDVIAKVVTNLLLMEQHAQVPLLNLFTIFLHYTLLNIYWQFSLVQAINDIINEYLQKWFQHSASLIVNHSSSFRLHSHKKDTASMWTVEVQLIWGCSRILSMVCTLMSHDTHSLYTGESSHTWYVHW